MTYENPTLSGENIFGVGFGGTVTIAGANGYSATGRAALDYGTYTGASRGTPGHLRADDLRPERAPQPLAAATEREQAFDDPDGDPTTTRNNSACGSAAGRWRIASA